MNKDLITKMLEYCGMSYTNCQVNFENEKIIIIDDSKTDIQCFLRIKRSNMIIIFRGSDSKKDWKADFKFWKTNIPYGNYSKKVKVHAGFVGTYSSKNVRKKIHSFIDDSIKKIYITGHSYGAALAVLCALDLKNNFSKIDYEIVVFGCPRVGNVYFKNLYNLKLFKTIRVENAGDLVTKVPLAILGYRHVGASLKIGGKCILNVFYSMKNHNLQEYYSNIWHF